MPAWPLPVLLFLLLRPTGYRWLAGGCYCSQSYQVHACTHGKKRRRHVRPQNKSRALNTVAASE
jgi:hypothetical protein